MRRLLLILAAPMMFLITTAAVCDGQYPLDSTRDVVMDFSNIERSTDVCLNWYHGSPQVIGDVFICKAVKDYPVYGITPGFPN